MIRKIQSFKRKKNETVKIEETNLAEKSIGKILQERRMELKIEILEVANSLNAKVRNIEAIENDDFALIDKNTYVFGLVSEYAKFVGIKNISEQLRILNKNKSSIVKISYKSTEEAKLPTSDFITIALCVFVSLTIVFLFYSHKKSSFQEKTINKIITRNYEKSH